MMRLEDAIFKAQYIRSIAADVRGVGRMMRVCMVDDVWCWACVVYRGCQQHLRCRLDTHGYGDIVFQTIMDQSLGISNQR